MNTTDSLQMMLSIQPDWSDELRIEDGNAWISLKKRGEKGRHARLVSSEGKPSTATIEGDDDASPAFLLEKATASALIVKSTSGLTFKVIRPFSVFNSIHSKGINAIDVSKGGLGVSVGDESSSIMVWESSQGVLRRELTGHVGDIYRVRLFPSGVVVLSCGNDMRLKIWSAEDGSCPRTLIGHKGTVTDSTIVDEGMNIVSVSKDGTLKLWSCGQGKCLEPSVAIGDVINCCDIINIEGLDEFTFPPFNKTVDDQESTDFDPTCIDREHEVNTANKLICAGGENGSVTLVNLHSRRVVYRVQLDSAVNVVKFYGCSHMLVGCENGEIVGFNLSQMEGEPFRWHDSNSQIQSILPLPGQEGFVAGRGDGSCVFYPISQLSNFRVVLSGADIDPITAIASDSEFIYTSARDGNIRKYAIKHLSI